jgi:hypothetical protein
VEKEMKKASDYKTVRGLHNHYLNLVKWCLLNNQIRLGVEMLLGVRIMKDSKRAVKKAYKLMLCAENLRENR